jgi:hypothetical protein
MQGHDGQTKMFISAVGPGKSRDSVLTANEYVTTWFCPQPYHHRERSQAFSALVTATVDLISASRSFVSRNKYKVDFSLPNPLKPLDRPILMQSVSVNNIQY